MSRDNTAIVEGVRTPLKPLGEWTSRRRTPDEHLRVRFPALFRRLAEAVQRLSPQSRLRRSIVARSIARAYAAANRGDFELILSGYDPATYEYHPSIDLLPPDMESVFYGHDGYRELWRYWTDAFEDIHWAPLEVLDLGDKALVTAEQSGHGSGSGIAVSHQVFQLFTFRRGLVIRQQDFLNRAVALDAADVRD